MYQLSSDKYCLDKLLMSHNFSHIYQGDVAHFAYVCLNMEQSVSEIVETVVYPIGVAVSMSCLTLTFLLYSFLPQLRDLTGKFILGICSFLTTNYALRLVDVEMFGFKVKKNKNTSDGIKMETLNNFILIFNIYLFKDMSEL